MKLKLKILYNKNELSKFSKFHTYTNIEPKNARHFSKVTSRLLTKLSLL